MTAQNAGSTVENRQHRDRIMWVTPSRIAYRGLFGRPGTRTVGAWLFYVALESPFQLSFADQPGEAHWIALVPPYVPHQISTKDRSLGQILLEVETLRADHGLAQLVASPEQRERTRHAILEGFREPLDHPDAFDRHFFGTAFPARELDARVKRVIEQLSQPTGGNLTAEECAAQIAVSFSYFTHLFTSQTGSSFRRLRAWKRARAFLPFVTSGASLVNIALDTGYADSTHFSHAIRQVYGYRPCDIIAGSRRLAVVTEWTQAA